MYNMKILLVIFVYAIQGKIYNLIKLLYVHNVKMYLYMLRVSQNRLEDSLIMLICGFVLIVEREEE